LAAPTLLVVGEVARLADPAVLLETSATADLASSWEFYEAHVVSRAKSLTADEESIL